MAERLSLYLPFHIVCVGDRPQAVCNGKEKTMANDIITEKQVQHVANIARLHFDQKGMQAMMADMASIIAYADQLSAVDTQGVPPTTHAIPLTNVYRKDVCTPSFDREYILAGAPDTDGECFIVPGVIEED